MLSGPGVYHGITVSPTLRFPADHGTVRPRRLEPDRVDVLEAQVLQPRAVLGGCVISALGLDQGLKWFKSAPIPPIEHRRLHVVRMRQKVLLAAALLHNPNILLLDEPFSGLDVNSALVLRRLVQELAARGKVVLFSSHELEIVERVSSRVVILHKGRVAANDSIENLRALMSLATLEDIFSQLAVEQNTENVTNQMMQLMEL